MALTKGIIRIKQSTNNEANTFFIFYIVKLFLPVDLRAVYYAPTVFPYYYYICPLVIAAIAWLIPLLDLNDQVTVTKGWMTLMPPQIFAGVKPLIKNAAAQDWDKIAQKIPELNDK